MSFQAVYGHTARLVSNWDQLINGRCFLAEEYLILVAVTNKFVQYLWLLRLYCVLVLIEKGSKMLSNESEVVDIDQ